MSAPGPPKTPGSLIRSSVEACCSLKLDGRDGFLADVPEDAIHAGDSGDDPVTHGAEHAEGNLGNGSGHGIHGIDRADDDGPAHVALSLSVHELDAGGLQSVSDYNAAYKKQGKASIRNDDKEMKLAFRKSYFYPALNRDAAAEPDRGIDKKETEAYNRPRKRLRVNLTKELTKREKGRGRLWMSILL